MKNEFEKFRFDRSGSVHSGLKIRDGKNAGLLSLRFDFSPSFQNFSRTFRKKKQRIPGIEIRKIFNIKIPKSEK